MFHSRAISVEDGATHYLFGSLPEHCETTFHVDDIILADESYIMVAAGSRTSHTEHRHLGDRFIIL